MSIHHESPKPETAAPLRLARALLGNRILHFLLLGGAIFAALPDSLDEHTIALDAEQVGAIWAGDESRRLVPTLTLEEKQEALTKYVEDELLYREGLRLGFDKDDRIVRNRVIQKTMFYAEAMAGAAATPTDEVLRDYFARTPDRWRRDPDLRVQQVFVSSAHGASAVERARELRSHLRADPTLDPKRLGDRVALLYMQEWSKPVDITRDLGETFAQAVTALPVGDWSEPLASAFGWHVVRVLERKEGRLPEFDEIKGQLALDYQFEAKRIATARMLERLRKEYRVRVEVPIGEAARVLPTGTGRIATESGH